jgi:PleD family two-component response regulator
MNYAPPRLRTTRTSTELQLPPAVADDPTRIVPFGVPTAASAAVLDAEPEPDFIHNEVGDDRDVIRPGDKVLLIVENDLGFARFLLDAAHEHGFKGLVTSMGASALAMIRDHKPSVITLDINLPDMQGWRVLDRLKNDTAHAAHPHLRDLNGRRP